MSLRLHELDQANHTIMNPITHDKLMLVGDICKLQPGMTQLDLACGQGEMLCQWAKRYDVTGTGVDISEVFLASARQRAEELSVSSQLKFVHDDAGQYPTESQNYDVVSCIGATWIGNGTVGTLNLMKPALKDPKEGLLLVGEVFWNEDPPDAACVALGINREDTTDLSGLLTRFDDAGVQLVEMVLASLDGWDRYEAKKWMTAYHWLRENPNDPDAAEFKQWIADNQSIYLQYGRRYCGWGVFVLKVKE